VTCSAPELLGFCDLGLRGLAHVIGKCAPTEMPGEDVVFNTSTPVPCNPASYAKYRGDDGAARLALLAQLHLDQHRTPRLRSRPDRDDGAEMTGPIVSPGGWQVPSGRKPGWDWTPPGGATARSDRMPRTVRILYRTPFLDRYAHQCMWWRGGWDVDPPPELKPAVAAQLVRSTPDRRERIEIEIPGWIARAVSFVIGLIDPAERYMQRHSPRVPTRRWAVRRVSASALRPPREDVERMIAEHEATLRVAERRYGGQVRACAQELVRTGATVVRLQNAQIRGRIVRFRRGDSILHSETMGPGQKRGGMSLVRLSAVQRDDLEVITRYLLQDVAHHGGDPR
jgi:hypothetical protein